MAQTVALDHYAESVERMIVSFMRMNMKIEETGNFDLLDKKDLYKLVASNNTVITNVLSKVRLSLFVPPADRSIRSLTYFVSLELRCLG